MVGNGRIQHFGGPSLLVNFPVRSTNVLDNPDGVAELDFDVFVRGLLESYFAEQRWYVLLVITSQ